jgi:DNA-directed RNA polymerase subunit RPC12/RpoP
MDGLIRCKNCRSQKWNEIGVVTTEKVGKGYSKKKLYQCMHCLRVLMVDGEMPTSSNPLDVI